MFKYRLIFEIDMAEADTKGTLVKLGNSVFTTTKIVLEQAGGKIVKITIALDKGVQVCPVKPPSTPK